MNLSSVKESAIVRKGVLSPGNGVLFCVERDLYRMGRVLVHIRMTHQSVCVDDLVTRGVSEVAIRRSVVRMGAHVVSINGRKIIRF
jgi:hypothetical protein